MRPNFCNICGTLTQNTCSLCGQPTCEKHMDPRSGACMRCSPKKGDERGLMDGPRSSDLTH
ncbi:MAG: hypothetical protein WC375_05980 [Methanomassiliicoccales archaeon]